MTKTEYLLLYNSEDGFCKTVDEFNMLIGTNKNLVVNEGIIRFKSKDYTYEVSSSQLDDNKHTVFHVILSCEKTTDKYIEMLRLFRAAVNRNKEGHLIILWDDVSFERAKKLYPLIYEVENQLRKLICKFMLTKLGLGWETSIPQQVTSTVKADKADKQEKSDSHYTILHKVDFIQLRHYLFTPYSTKEGIQKPVDRSAELERIITKLKKSGFTTEIENSLKDLVERSNWDRHFSSLVECSGEELEEKWQTLYLLRNLVAHNKEVTKENCQQTESICSELRMIFEKAISKMDLVELPPQEVEATMQQYIVQESVAPAKHAFAPYSNSINSAILNLGKVGAAINSDVLKSISSGFELIAKSGVPAFTSVSFIEANKQAISAIVGTASLNPFRIASDLAAGSFANILTTQQIPDHLNILRSLVPSGAAALPLFSLKPSTDSSEDTEKDSNTDQK